MFRVSSLLHKNKRVLSQRLLSFVGSIFFYVKKIWYWHTSGTKFAQQHPTTNLPTLIFSHQSPLFRELRDVDPYLQQNKVHNLRIAIQQLNSIVIQPGETFSYWRQIGNPTTKKGYREGMILRRGQLHPGIGGGLCQLSNLIYWMTLHTPLTVIERWRHSYDVFPDANRTQPFGSGATCSYPNIDLQIKNETQQPFQLKLELSDTHLLGVWTSDHVIPYRYTITEQDHRIEHTTWGGYIRSNALWRTTYDKQTQLPVKKELITENTALMMYEPLLPTSSSEPKANL